MLRRSLKLRQPWKFCLHARQKSDKCYILPMFPYPSGNLHMGHMRVYSISDVMARYFRLNGLDVIHPMGWDSFGLPAENAAIERGVDPAEWTDSNIADMKEQLRRIGVQFDWDRELSTCDPAYFRWTQFIFLKLHEHGLVQRRYSPVHWDPVDKTVLAAEQIDHNGRSWRSGALVEKRNLEQWAVETPRYIARLVDGLEQLCRGSRSWEQVAAIQANWLGKCDVYRFLLPIQGGERLEKFDLRLQDPTELARADFLVVLPTHPCAEEGRSGRYISKKSVHDPIFNRTLPVVVLEDGADLNSTVKFFMDSRVGFKGKCALDNNLVKTFGMERNSEDGERTDSRILELAEAKNCGGYRTSRKQSDWIVSRQRAWGTPIPMLRLPDGTFQPVPADQLPVLGRQRGQKLGDGTVETDTLDTFFDSSWYFLRFLDPHNQSQLAGLERQRAAMPVHLYVGGIEHADCHMFFARFVAHFLHDIGLASTPEPFAQVLPQGLVKGQTFVQADGRYLRPDMVSAVGEDRYVSKETGAAVDVVFEKMSKSKGNGVDPLHVINELGVDMSRIMLLRSAAPRSDLNWTTKDLKGLTKWVERVRWLVETYVDYRKHQPDAKPSPDEKRDAYCKEVFNYHVLNVSICLELLHLHNTAVMNLQGMTSSLRKMSPDELGSSTEAERCIHALIVMLQVVAPDLSAELWRQLGAVSPYDVSLRAGGGVDAQKWPEIDADADVEFIVRMLGTTCVKASVPRTQIEDLDAEALLSLAKRQHHRDFFNVLDEFDIIANSTRIRRRKGLYVCLDLDLADEVGDEHVTSVLKRYLQLKTLARKSEKKKGKATSAA